MKFNVKSPCALCPFRKDVKGYLHPKRAEDLAKKLTEDDMSWFACHETTTKLHRRVTHKDAAQCAGSMILLKKIKLPNVSMRLAYVFKLLTPDGLNMNAPVFDNFEQFIEHHAGRKIAAKTGKRTDPPAHRVDRADGEHRQSSTNRGVRRRG